MELIDRYIYAVTHRLPVDMQADVSDELRATIDEALDKKGSRSPKAIKEVLTELGNPAILAARYSSTPQYIIGPKFYPIFVQALKLVLAIGLPIAVVVGVIINIVDPPATIIQAIINIIGHTINLGIQMLFWTALVFFIIERCGVNERDLRKNSGWTPDMLPAATAKRQIPLADGIAEVIWYSLVIALPFIARPLVGAHIDGKTTPFFNPDIWTVGGPVLVALGVLGVVKAILKIRLGKWTKPLALFNTGYALAFSALLIVAAVAGSLVNPAFLTEIDKHITTANLDQVTQTTNWTVGISITVFVGIYLYDAAHSLYRAFHAKSSTPTK